MTPEELDLMPEHMRADAEFYNHWAPEYYEESECVCGRPIYRYQMDVVIEWKHFDHHVYCNPPQRATPREGFMRNSNDG